VKNDPNRGGHPLLPNWPAYEAMDNSYRDIGERIVSKSNLRKEKLDAHDRVARENDEIRPKK
jgi:hypothetical protein